MGIAPYDNAIQALATMLGKVADAFKISKEEQSQTAIIKEDKRQEKALIASNAIIDLVYKNIEFLPDDVQ